MPTRLIDDDSGDLRTGFFYQLHSDSSSGNGYRRLVFPEIHMEPDQVSSLFGEPTVTQWEVAGVCEAVPGHRREIRLAARIQLELTGSAAQLHDQVIQRFVTSLNYHFVPEGLARGLEELGYKGLLARQADAEGAPAPVYFIRGALPAPFKPRVVDPPSLNLCPWCLRAPAACLACGTQFTRCIRCDREIFCPSLEQHRGRDDPRILVESPSIEGEVLDLGHWNGDDVLGDDRLVISARLYRKLLGLGARNFAVTPLRMDVAGISPEKWELLEQVIGVTGFRGYPWPQGSIRPPK